MTRRTSIRTSTAAALLALAGSAAFFSLPQPRDAVAYPPGGTPADAQPQELPPGHPQIESTLPPGHPPIGTQLPPGHPTLGGNSAGDGQTSGPPPVAEPADVASIESICGAYYASISAPAGEPRNWDRFRSLFIPEGRLIAAQAGQPGSPAAVLTPDQFVRMNAAYFQQGGYIERDISRRIDTFGNTAHIFSTYETRRAPEGEPYSRGINSIQLVNDGSRWWIATVMWDYERPENPIPEVYLPPARTLEEPQ